MLEVAHRHGGVENDFAAFFLHLIDQFRRLRPRERRKKDRSTNKNAIRIIIA